MSDHFVLSVDVKDEIDQEGAFLVLMRSCLLVRSVAASP